MSSPVRKRMRDADGPTLPPELVRSLRGNLADRASADVFPAAWRAANSGAGVSDADAFLCHLGRTINEALLTVPTDSETARDHLRAIRAGLISAVNSRCDELEARISAAENTKVAALERQLCDIDAVLSQLRVERAAAAEAAASLGDAELGERHADLTARLDAAEARLLTLPTCLLEPPSVKLTADASALLHCIADFGRVVAPRSVTAADLTLEESPRYAQSGDTLRWSLALRSSLYASQTAEELEKSLGAASESSYIDIALEAIGLPPLPLRTQISLNILGRCVTITAVVPLAAPAGSFVGVRSLAVFGQSVPCPLRISVRHVVRTPLRLQWADEACYAISLCVSPARQFFVTQSSVPAVCVFDAEGRLRPSSCLDGIDPAMQASHVAFADGVDPLLLLAETNKLSSRVTALNPYSKVANWTTAPQSMRTYDAIALLPDHDVAVIVSSEHDFFRGTTSSLLALRLSDGIIINSHYAGCTIGPIAADPASGVIFGSWQPHGEDCGVHSFSWSSDSGWIDNDYIKSDISGSWGPRPMAVIPAPPGKKVSHLVVGSSGDGGLDVLSLPDLVLVHKHDLEGIEVGALAADPWGEFLAVSCDGTNAIDVLAWPLPGMREMA